MNYFVEGLQGSGKTTLVHKIYEDHPDHTLVKEGDHSPLELAWCAYLDEKTYQEILDLYPDMKQIIKENTYCEGNRKIVTYTRIRTDDRRFYQDLEKYEIYNGRVSYEDFRSTILSRFKAWDQDKMIFECSLFQNIVEDMILFRCMTDEEIIDFYKEIRNVLKDKEYKIVYLKTDDIRSNLDVIRKERSDESGNELWFPAMMGFFNDSPYAKMNGLKGEDDLIDHFRHRQDLELKICKEVFADRYAVLFSKGYTQKELEES